MGTAREWVSVVVAAIFWGGWMLIWSTRKRRKAHIEPVLSVVDVVGWALAGVSFGLATTFGWRAFHWPLVLLSGATFFGGVGVFAGAKSSFRKVT